MWAQHQAVAHRHAAAAAAAQVQAGLGADRAEQALPPGQFGAEGEQAAAFTAGGTEDRRTEGQTLADID